RVDPRSLGTRAMWYLKVLVAGRFEVRLEQEDELLGPRGKGLERGEDFGRGGKPRRARPGLQDGPASQLRGVHRSILRVRAFGNGAASAPDGAQGESGEQPALVAEVHG